MATDMTLFENAVDQVIVDSERLHNVVNGTAVEEVITEDGSVIPTIRKAMLDNIYFKTPPLPWTVGATCTVFNQLYAFKSAAGTQWFYAPSASVDNPVRLPADPTESGYWKIFLDSKYMEDHYATKESPVFTGNPQCPTASLESEDETIANTSFVHQLVRSQLLNLQAGTLALEGLNVNTLIKTNNLSVSGNASFAGLVEASGSQGKFRQVTLTKEGSTLDFSYRNPLDPDELSTLLDYHSVTTDSITSHKIVNGSASSDNDTMSLEGVGNNRFDYVYITGSGAKGSDEPTLKVSGITQLENVVITGDVQGISHSVDGIDILPNSVGTKRLTVTEALTVQGAANFSGINTNTLSAEGALTANTVTGVEGSFTTLAVTNGNISGALSVEGETNISNNLTVLGSIAGQNGATIGGDVALNGNSGTTTVHNLVVNGTVSGINFDITDQHVTVKSLSSTTDIMASGSISSTKIIGSEARITGALKAGKVEFSSETLSTSTDIPTGVWNPDGASSVYVLNLDSNVTLDAWAGITAAGTEDDPKPNAFSAIIYVIQDATGGHALTFSSNYAVVSRTQAIGGTANQVSILQLTYPGFGDIVDVIIAQRNV